MDARFLVVICQEGRTEAFAWDTEADARKQYEDFKVNWSEVFLCTVMEGPRDLGCPQPSPYLGIPKGDTSGGGPWEIMANCTPLHTSTP